MRNVSLKNSWPVCISFALFSLQSISLAQTQPILNIDPSTQIAWNPGPGQYFGFDEFDGGNGVIGWTFTLTQPVTIKQVGWFDDGLDGLGQDFQVGLWKGRLGGFSVNSPQLLGAPASGVTIPGGTAASLDGVWRVIDLPSPLFLDVGEYELAGVETPPRTDPIKYALIYGTTDPGLTRSLLTIGSPVVPETTGFAPSNVFILVYGLELGPMLFIEVPEPSTLLLATFGLTLLLTRR